MAFSFLWVLVGDGIRKAGTSAQLYRTLKINTTHDIILLFHTIHRRSRTILSITTVLFDLGSTLPPMDQDVFVKDYFGRRHTDYEIFITVWTISRRLAKRVFPADEYDYQMADWS